MLRPEDLRRALTPLSVFFVETDGKNFRVCNLLSSRFMKLDGMGFLLLLA